MLKKGDILRQQSDSDATYAIHLSVIDPLVIKEPILETSFKNSVTYLKGEKQGNVSEKNISF